MQELQDLRGRLDAVRQKGFLGSLESARQLRALGHWPSALELLSALRYNTLQCGRFQYGAVLSVAAKVSSWSTTQRLLLDPDAAAYTTSMSAMERSSHWEKGVQHFERMALRRLADLRAWTALAARPWRGAMEVLGAARRRGVEADTATSVVVLRAMEWQDVLKKLQADRQSGLELGVWALSASTACWRRSLSMVAKAPANIVVYNALCARSPWTQCLEILRCTAIRRLRPDLVGYSSALSLCGSSRAWPMATWLMAQWRAPDAQMARAALEATGNWQVGLALLEDLTKLKMSPDTRPVAAAAAEAHQWQVALSLGLREAVLATSLAGLSLWRQTLRVASLLATQGAGRADVYAISMSTLERCSQWQSEQLLFQDLLAWRCELDVVCFNCAMKSCGSHQWAAAFSLHEPSNLVSATELVRLCGESGEWRSAVLIGDGLQADVVLASSLCAAHQRSCLQNV